MNTLKEIKERFDAWSLQEAKKEDWAGTLDQVIQSEGIEQTLLDFVGAIFIDKDLSEKMLQAIIRAVPEDAVREAVAYLSRSYGDGSYQVEEARKPIPAKTDDILRQLLRDYGAAEVLEDVVDEIHLQQKSPKAGSKLSFTGTKALMAMFYALPKEVLKQHGSNLLSAVLMDIPAEELTQVISQVAMKRGPEGFVDERLSRKEIALRKKRKTFGKAPEDDADIPDEMRALSNGVVGNRSDDEELEENECAGNPYRSNSGKYSSHREPGSYTLPKKPKSCATKSGQGRRGAGSRDNDKSEKPCGRKKKADGSQTKCRDGSPR